MLVGVLRRKEREEAKKRRNPSLDEETVTAPDRFGLLSSGRGGGPAAAHY